jgi:hypothetical protein
LGIVGEINEHVREGLRHWLSPAFTSAGKQQGWASAESRFTGDTPKYSFLVFKEIPFCGPPTQIWSISKKYIPLGKGCTMKNLSLKLEDDIFQETEKIITKVKKNRNRYINEAIEFYNRLHKRRLLSKQLSKESKIVAKDSMEVLAEFEKLNGED